MPNNPNFDVEINEPTSEDVVMTVWRMVNGARVEEVFATYNLKKYPDQSTEEVCQSAAPYLFI